MDLLDDAIEVMHGIKRKRTWRCPTLTWGDPTLPSALDCFTSEFGMESGGSNRLWSPGKIVSVVAWVKL